MLIFHSLPRAARRMLTRQLIEQMEAIGLAALTSSAAYKTIV
jgi:hypothetical protein